MVTAKLAGLEKHSTAVVAELSVGNDKPFLRTERVMRFRDRANNVSHLFHF